MLDRERRANGLNRSNLNAAKQKLSKQLPAPRPALTTAVSAASDGIGRAVKTCRSFGPSTTPVDFERYSKWSKMRCCNLIRLYARQARHSCGRGGRTSSPPLEPPFAPSLPRRRCRTGR